MRALSRVDQLIGSIDKALRTLGGGHSASRPIPRPAAAAAAAASATPMTDAERSLAAGLMRVNHVGEVCAQALYDAQSAATPDPVLKAHFAAAARQESDHLVWTEQRLAELGGRASWLNPLWYAGAYGIGLIAGRRGRAASLGFVVETERQVEQHLARHLDRLPYNDQASRAIVAQMREDEARHAAEATEAGGTSLSAPARWTMRAVSAVMTTTARYI